MNRQIAHNIENKDRTDDVHIIENVDFTAMLLSDQVLQGLLANGFKKPSPIQLKAIPMGRCGYDLIIQAKSGTGKTAVFGIIALEMIDVTISDLQVLILAPTREIAVQIQDVLQSIGMNLKGLNVQYFIGGTSVKDDLKKLKNCHIAVGAPGRVKHLIKDGHMKVDSVRLFVLDEADKLLAKEQQKEINFIYNKLNSAKQMIASSATYPGELKTFLFKYMQTPTVIDPHQDVPVLLGIRQFVTIVNSHSNALQQMTLKTNELIRILKNVSFSQCIVFCNYQTRAETLTNNLSQQGWPSTYISAAQNQQARLDAVTSLKEFKCRILTTTDLTARGIDAANVDLVINYEVPIDSETYLHRMGRAGRYGSSGICVSITSEGTEEQKLQKLLDKITSKLPVMIFPKENVPQDIWTCDVDHFEKLCVNKNDPDLSVTQDSSDEKSDNKEHIIESIIEIVKSDNKVETGDSIELLLQNLEKEDEQTKESCKNKLNNMNPEALLQMISKDLEIDKDKNSPEKLKVQETLCDQMDENIDVEKMLFSLKEEEETSKNKMKMKLNLDPSSILKLLTQDKLDNSQTTSESLKEIDLKIKKSKIKKVKPNDIKNKEESSNSNDTEKNEQFENEAKLFQENSIIYKNIALYNITKVVVKEEVTEENVISTENLLKIMEEEDNLEIAEQKSKLELTDLLNQLGIKSGESQSSINEWVVVNDESQSTDDIEIGKNINNWEVVDKDSQKMDEDVKCTCSENLLCDMYNFAISNSGNWKDGLCNLHKNIEEEAKDEESVEEEYVDEEYEDEEYIEEEYENDYNDSEEQCDESYEENEETLDTEVEIDEDIFVKAYDYALKREVQDYEEINEDNQEEEACGYAASYSYDHLVSRRKRRRNKEKSKQSELGLILNGENTYESYFDYCDKLLRENGPYFTDQFEFEKWFKTWQEQLARVRNYVQDDMFAKELKKNSKN